MNEKEPVPVEKPADAAARFRHLPEPVDLDATVATHETEPAPDPEGGRDPERDFMLRYGAL
jgi:hypothetical protein